MTESIEATLTKPLHQGIEVIRNWASQNECIAGDFHYQSTESAPEGSWTGERAKYDRFLWSARKERPRFIFINHFYFDRRELRRARRRLRSLTGDAHATLEHTIDCSASWVGALCEVMIAAPCSSAVGRPHIMLMMGDWVPWYPIVRAASDAYLDQYADMDEPVSKWFGDYPEC